MQNNINVTLGLSDESIHTLSNIVADNIDIDSLSSLDDKIQEKIDDALDDYTIDTKIRDWFDDNIDVNDIVNDVIQDINFNDYIDIDSNTVEDAARELLNAYSPLRTCSTGGAFTDAIALAVRHFLLDNDNVHYIVKALDRFEKDKMKNEVEEQLRTKHFEEFRQQLQTFSIQTVQTQEVNTYPHIHNQTTNNI